MNNVITGEDLELLFSKTVNLYSISLQFLTVKNANFLRNLRTNNVKEVSTYLCKFDSSDYFYNFLSKLKNLIKIEIIDESNRVWLALDALIISECEILNEIWIGTDIFNIADHMFIDSSPENKILNLLYRQKRLRELSLPDIKSLDFEFLNKIPNEHLKIL